MSHFTVLVVGEEVDNQLAPYQENNMGDCPPEFMQFFDKQEEMEQEWEDNSISVSEWYPDFQFNKDDIPENKFKELEKTGTTNLVDIFEFNFAFNKDKIEGGKGVLYIRDKDKGKGNIYFQISNAKEVPHKKNTYDMTITKIDKPKEIPIREHYASFDEFIKEYHGYTEKDKKMNRYGYWENPNAKWDWYQIGGRWAGFFKMKNGKSGEMGERSWCNAGAEIEENRADQAYKGDIDWEGMLSDNFESNSKAYDKFEKLLKEDPEQAKRDAYFKYGVENKGDRDNFIPETREEYLKSSVPVTFAVVKDGKWYEKGKMGWWAFVTDKKEQGDWNEEFKKLIDNVSDDTLLTVVDCHI